MTPQETARSIHTLLYRAYHQRGLEESQRVRAALNELARAVNTRVENWRANRWAFSMEQMRELKLLALLEVREPAPRLLDAISSASSYGGLGEAETVSFIAQFPALHAARLPH